MRRGALVPLLLAVAASVGCAGGDGGDAAATTAVPTTPSVPTDAAAGEGTFVLGLRTYALTVDECTLEPAPGDAPGVTTELAVAASGPDGVRVLVRRESFTGAAPTVTDTVDHVVDGGGGLVAQAQRVDADGRILDLREPRATSRLIEVVDGTLVVAEGRFGAPGARGPEPTDVDGTLVLRCP